MCYPLQTTVWHYIYRILKRFSLCVKQFHAGETILRKTRNKNTAKIEVLYQQTHVYVKNLQWLPNAFPFLTRAGKKGLYNTGPAPWQQGARETPIPKCQSHLPGCSHVLCLHFIFSTEHSSFSPLTATTLWRAFYLPSNAHQSYTHDWISAGIFWGIFIIHLLIS